MLKFSVSLIVLIFSLSCRCQNVVYQRYDSALIMLTRLLEHNATGDFRQAVYIVENAYSDRPISETSYNTPILVLSTIVKEWLKANSSAGYLYGDSLNVLRNYAVFKILKDTMKLELPDGNIYKTVPFTYDFNDFEGRADWSNMFVSKLLRTHSGNCHKLPYL